MDFPARPPIQTNISDIVKEAFGKSPIEVWRSRDLLALFETENDISELQPNMEKLRQIKDSFAVIATAKGDSVDFVSRFFAPNAGIPEDPVTGSAHCTLIPFWANKLNKDVLHAKQLSKRTGELFCVNKGEKISLIQNGWWDFLNFIYYTYE
jgi:predicted PhzF superfamily epimerase YddE/YHI9